MLAIKVRDVKNKRNILVRIPNYATQNALDVFELIKDDEFIKKNGNKLSFVSQKSNRKVKRIIKSYPIGTPSASKNGSEARVSFLKEVEMLLLVKHPNIVRMIQAGSFNEDYCLMLEFCEKGTLSSQLKTVTREKAYHYFEQICAALKHLHNQRIVHRDIKGANIVVTVNDVIKLIDFEYATVLAPGETMVQGVKGTYGYMAPEMKTNPSFDGYKIDMYALGAVLWCLLFKRDLPKVNLFPYEELLKMVSENMDLTTIERQLLNGLLTIDPSERWDIGAVLSVVSKLCRKTDETDKTEV